MRIAFINSVAGFGSTGKIVYQLSKIDGVDGKLYYGRKKNTTDANSFRFTHFLGNVHQALHTYAFDTHAFCNGSETKRLIRDLKEFNPDIIHLHNLHGYYIHAGVLFDYLKESGKPVIWTLHDCWSFTGHCAHYESIGCEKWKTECRNCPGLHKYPVTFNGSHVSEHFQKKNRLFNSLGDRLTIVTPSQWLKEQVSQSFLKDNRAVVISNGIDTKIFTPVESDYRKKHHLDNKYIILAVASIWDDTKGLKDLQQMSKQLHENEKLIVIGVRNEQMKGFDQEHTICMNRTEHVHELVDLYSTADLFLNLTIEDTYPTVNLEALACGCPIMTYRTGGSTEMVQETTGIVIDKQNLSLVIHKIHMYSKQGSPFSKKDCITAARKHTVANMQQEYLNLYRQVGGAE